MSAELKRTHVLLPADLLAAIDRRVGARQRSAFLTEAARHELRRRSQVESLRKYAGFLKDVDIPGWETPEAAAEWVHQQRRIGSDPWDEVDSCAEEA